MKIMTKKEFNEMRKELYEILCKYTTPKKNPIIYSDTDLFLISSTLSGKTIYVWLPDRKYIHDNFLKENGFSEEEIRHKIWVKKILTIDHFIEFININL